VEAAAQIAFYTFAHNLGIKRFIIDEAHQYIDDQSYRTYMAGVARLRSIAGQFVFTTGSLSPSQQGQLLQRIFNLVQVQVFRESTVRPELFFEVRDNKIHTAVALWFMVKDEWTKHCTNDQSRMMVFVQSHAGVEVLGKTLVNKGLPAAYYHASLEPQLGQEQILTWRQTNRCIMVATCAFGAGINYAHVRSVICWGIPNQSNLNQVFQQAGRAGRDGQQAHVILVSQKTPTWEPDHVTKNLLNPGACPIRVMSSILDETASSCVTNKMMTKCVPCTLVSGGGRAIPPRNLSVNQRIEDIGSMNLGEGSSHSAQDRMGPVLGNNMVGLEVGQTKQILNINQKHAAATQTKEKQLAGRLAMLKNKYQDACGWCLAKRQVRDCHMERWCESGLANSCFSCKSKWFNLDAKITLIYIYGLIFCRPLTSNTNLFSASTFNGYQKGLYSKHMLPMWFGCWCF